MATLPEITEMGKINKEQTDVKNKGRKKYHRKSEK